LSSTYSRAIGERWELFARGDLQLRGPVYWDLGNTVRGGSKEFINLRAGFSLKDAIGKDFRFELFCENCTNNDYINESLVLADLGTSVHFTSRDARVFGIEASVRF
jgi:hypothetical protein